MNKKIRKTIRHYAEYLAARVLLSVIQTLPLTTCDQLAHRLAFVFTNWLKVRNKVIQENMKNVYPEWDAGKRKQVTYEMWHYLVMMVFEIAHAPRKIHETNWRKFISIPDNSGITRNLLDVRPTLVVSGHFGNFELGGYVTGLLGFSTHTMVRKLDNPLVDKLVAEFRGRNGQYMLPKEGSAVMVQELMEQGGTITVLGDQHAGTKGCWIDFLGRPAACHKAIALFTLTGNTPMVLCLCRRTGAPLEFEITSPGIADPKTLDPELADVKSLTQWYNDQLADYVRRYPAQYWWIHRRWKEKPIRKTKKRLQKNAA
jgi:KDO2-lipid IV(A) lauroyltransferase